MFLVMYHVSVPVDALRSELSFYEIESSSEKLAGNSWCGDASCGGAGTGRMMLVGGSYGSQMGSNHKMDLSPSSGRVVGTTAACILPQITLGHHTACLKEL